MTDLTPERIAGLRVSYRYTDKWSEVYEPVTPDEMLALLDAYETVLHYQSMNDPVGTDA